MRRCIFIAIYLSFGFVSLEYAAVIFAYSIFVHPDNYNNFGIVMVGFSLLGAASNMLGAVQIGRLLRYE